MHSSFWVRQMIEPDPDKSKHSCGNHFVAKIFI